MSFVIGVKEAGNISKVNRPERRREENNEQKVVQMRGYKHLKNVNDLCVQ